MTTWTWVQGRDGTGTMTFVDEFASLPTRLVMATADSVVFELLRPLAGADSMMLRFTGRARGDSLIGDAIVRIRDGRTGRRPFDGARIGPLPAFERAECMFERRPLPPNVECGWLVVPESRSKPLGRTVRLAVMIRRATQPTGKPPLVFLHGGPGGRAVLPLPPDPPTLDRDMISYDQRASGFSQPALCLEYNDSILANQPRLTRLNRAEVRRPWIQACVASLRAQGIDPDAYNTSTSAHDVADLRRALGYERWIVRGGSYGTRLAQEAMRVDPLGIHGVVLTAPVPASDEENVLEWRLQLQRTLQRLFAACAAHPACHQAFPDPEGDFHALYDELTQTPLRVPAANGQDTIVLHGDRLVTAITTTLDGTARLPRIPLLLHELRRGDRLRAARALAPAVDPQAGGLSRALNNLVNCYEPVETPRTVADSLNALLLRPFRITVDPDACTLWRSRFVTPDERSPVHSDIPTLILAGEFDARTPIENARRIARTLTRAYVYELPGTGHNGQPPCMQDIIRQFLNDPTRTPDASCIARMPRISFLTRWEGQP
jgi:pimeloyl-ACP methyl ester carboxylesterase